MTTVPCWARVRGPLAPYAEGFRVELERLGYTPLTAATHVRLLAHLSRWLAREGVGGAGVDPGGGGRLLRRTPRGGLCRARHRPGAAAAVGLLATVGGGFGSRTGGPGEPGGTAARLVSGLSHHR